MAFQMLNDGTDGSATWAITLNQLVGAYKKKNELVKQRIKSFKLYF